MGIFGTLFGGTVGFMMGGPVGALLGGLMGSTVSRGMEAVAAQNAGLGGVGSIQQQQMLFATVLTSLAAKVAKADGQVIWSSRQERTDPVARPALARR